MNAFISALYRDLTCGTAAVVITVVFAATFVQSTSAAPGTRSDTPRIFALQASHGWFGQPEPAVLVD